MKIILNGTTVEVAAKRLSYEQIAAMAYQPTVVYARGPQAKPEGTLVQGQDVKVVEGMVITCMQTGNA